METSILPRRSGERPASTSSARTRKAVAPVFALASLLIAAPPLSAGDPPQPPFDLSDPQRVEAGKARFHSTCADFCHGHEPALFIGRKIEPAYAHDTIVNGGRGATPMPPWGDVFTDEEIWELVAYLQYLGEQTPK